MSCSSAPASAVLVLACVLGSVSCSGGSQADDPVGVEFPEVTHVLEPTDEMFDAAQQQCLDDPTLAEGYVKAVAPDSGDILAEVTVTCDQVRDDN